MELRPYQKAAVQAVFDYLCAPDKAGKNPCVEICTGGGKTLVFSQIVKETVEKWGGRVLVLTHVKELIEQGAEKLRLFCPNLAIGVYSAGLGSRDTQNQVVIAGIQSVYKRAEELGRFDLVLIDECQLLPRSGEGMYRTLLAALKAQSPHLRVVGFTATPYRTGSGPLCTPDGILNDICFATSIRLMIQDGYLSKIRSKVSKHAVDTDALSIRAGEFVATEVEAKVNDEVVVERACREIVALTRDRKAVILFCTSVAHCRRVARQIEALSGAPCGIVTAETPPAERADLLRRIRGEEGEPDLLGHRQPPLKFLANVNVCAVGFDAPNIDCVALLRPTASPGLYVQMAGRGLCLAPGKEDCLILDYGENILRHGPLDDVHPEAKRRGKRKDIKTCPSCGEVLTPQATACPECGYVFPAPKPKQPSSLPHRAHCSSANILSDGTHEKPTKTRTTYTVEHVEYAIHHSRKNPDAPPSLRVTFLLAGPPYRVSVWKQPASPYSWARKRFAQWWRQMAGEGAVSAIPRTAHEALEAIEVGAQLKTPATVTLCTTEGDAFPQDVAYTFAPEPTVEEALAATDDDLPF